MSGKSKRLRVELAQLIVAHEERISDIEADLKRVWILLGYMPVAQHGMNEQKTELQPEPEETTDAKRPHLLSLRNLFLTPEQNAVWAKANAYLVAKGGIWSDFLTAAVKAYLDHEENDE